mmetsp:Transcript_36662/g.80205  ORF Transcript_36662/g.80205 Transcript_36662/m.80205 type:complete len:324 (+) Transcript_36662:43-1014(+)
MLRCNVAVSSNVPVHKRIDWRDRIGDEQRRGTYLLQRMKLAKNIIMVRHRRRGRSPLGRQKVTIDDQLLYSSFSTQRPFEGSTQVDRSYSCQTQQQSVDTTPRKISYGDKKARAQAQSSFSPSLAPSSVSSASLDSLHDFDGTTSVITTTFASSSSSEHHRSSIKRAVSSILHPQRRISTASSLPWGHKPHPMVGASCLLFVLPVPFLSTCHPTAAAFFGVVTISSFLSDHVYTGLESWAHPFDKVCAVLTFSTAMRTVYSTGGPLWAASSSLAVACHVLAHSAAKRDEYMPFVFWHTMWHVVGVALLVACFWTNDTMTECIV